jgi:hypothetical protein
MFDLVALGRSDRALIATGGPGCPQKPNTTRHEEEPAKLLLTCSGDTQMTVLNSPDVFVDGNAKKIKRMEDQIRRLQTSVKDLRSELRIARRAMTAASLVTRGEAFFRHAANGGCTCVPARGDMLRR